MEALGGFFTDNWAKLLTGSMLGVGELGNIISEGKRSSYQDKLMSIINNPAQLAKMASSVAQPISAAQTQAINNQVQGDMAQRGLSQAPGIFGATEAQALAGPMQQNYNAALSSVLQMLGIPKDTFQQPTNLAPLMGLFMNQMKRPSPTPQTQPGLTPDWTIPGPALPPDPFSGITYQPAPPSAPPDWGGM